MNGFRRFYGEEIINLKELMEAGRKGLIKLEYYITKQEVENSASYGIEIIKKEYTDKQFFEEANKINDITSNEQYMENIVSIIKRNKVTPIGLEDIIKDLK